MKSEELLKQIKAELNESTGALLKLSSKTAEFYNWSQMILLTKYLYQVSDMLEEFKEDLFPFEEE